MQDDRNSPLKGEARWNNGSLPLRRTDLVSSHLISPSALALHTEQIFLRGLTCPGRTLHSSLTPPVYRNEHRLDPVSRRKDTTLATGLSHPQHSAMEDHPNHVFSMSEFSLGATRGAYHGKAGTNPARTSTVIKLRTDEISSICRACTPGGSGYGSCKSHVGPSPSVLRGSM